jgi:uncharacterized protein YlbG (UPF0298 family)
MGAINSYWIRVRKGLIIANLILDCFFIILGVILNGIIKGFVFGLLMSVLMLPVWGLALLMDYSALRRAFKRYGKIDYNLEQYREIEVACNRETAFNWAMESLKELKNVHDIEFDRFHGVIEARIRKFLKTERSAIIVKIGNGINNNLIVSISLCKMMRFHCWNLTPSVPVSPIIISAIFCASRGSQIACRT